MDKLLKLLNEFEKERIEKVNSKGLPIKLSFRPYTEEVLTNVAYKSVLYDIISKYYGFIKRLVENDKIDLGKLIMIKDEEQRAIIDIDNSRENTLLMLLSIQDDPVTFMLSILK